MKEKPSKKERLAHMVEAIERIFRFVEGMDYDKFSSNEMAKYAVIKCFEIIGEAAYQLPKEYRLANEGKIEWKKMMAFRHILVHDYYEISEEIVWNTIHEKLPDLNKNINELIEIENEST